MSAALGQSINPAQINQTLATRLISELSTVFNVGRYLDVVVRTPAGLRFESRLVVYDSEMKIGRAHV